MVGVVYKERVRNRESVPNIEIMVGKADEVVCRMNYPKLSNAGPSLEIKELFEMVNGTNDVVTATVLLYTMLACSKGGGGSGNTQ